MSTSSSTTNNTEVLGDHQEGNHNVETEISSDNKSKDVTEMSLKQLQVITFLSKIEGTLKNYLKEEQSFDYKVLQNVIKDLAVILKTGEKETQQFVEEMLNKDDNKILSLLVRASFSLFKATVMQGISLSPQHPLILAYYCISMIDPTEKFVKVGLIHPIVHHLKVMELFMTLTEENLTLAKLLISILCGCCNLDAALAVMVQSGAHYMLAYYTHMFGFNTALLAKSALAVIVNRVEEHFHRFVKFTNVELSNVQAILTTCVQSKSLNVKLTDRQGFSDYYIIGFLEMLQQLAVNPDNVLILGSSVFVRLYHSILVEPDLSDAAKSVLLLLKAICCHPANKKVLQQENILVTLEAFSDNEALEALATEVMWSILNEDSLNEVKQETKGNDVNDIKENKIAAVLRALFTTVKFFFLKNETASQITKMEFYEVKTVFIEIFSFLRYLMALSEHFTVAVIEKCSKEIQSALKVISEYCTWMICRDKLLEMSEWSLMHPLFLFHFLFYFLATICSDGIEQLRDSGVIDLIVKELWMIQLIPKWHKGIAKLAQLFLIILLKCFEFIPHRIISAGLLEQFCVEEDFLFRITTKPLLAAFSSQKSYNFKLIKLLESEASSLLNLLKSTSKDPKKVIQIISSVNDCMILHVRYAEVDFIISNLLKNNPDNQKIFYNCCAIEAVDLLATVHPSIQSRVENLIALIMGEDLSVADLNSTPSNREVCNQLLHQMCCVTNSIRIVLSDQVDDRLAEQYAPFEENSLFPIGQKDLLYSDLFQLTDISTTIEGVKAFRLFLLQMPQFFILLKSILNLSFKRFLENNSAINVPASSLFRLERIFSLLQDHCQKSSEFCAIMAQSGIINDLVNSLLTLYACQSHRSVDFEWILLHLAEPILYILAVCAVNPAIHGYMRYLPNLLKFYCSVNFERCGALAKISLSILCKSVFIASKDFELTDQEVDFVLELLSSVIYKQENIQYTWIAYTTDSNDSVYYFITFCLHLVANSSNAVKMLKVGIMDCIIYLFQHYEQEMPLKVALQLLAKLSAVVKLSAESHSSLINSLQQLMQKDTMKLDAFYCLLSLGIDVPKLIDLPDGYIDAVAMFRVGRYQSCIEKLKEMIDNKTEHPQMIQTIGESYYMLYALKPSPIHNQSKGYTVGADSERYKNAKQAIKYLGDAYDHQLFVDKDINSMHLDLAMMDCIFNVRDKPLSRCLLCRRKCGKGERLIRSHIWPEALMRHLMNGAPSGSKQVFDASWKGAGNLYGPGQIHFTMLCKACEDLFSKYEKAFKSLCFEKLYCSIDENTKQYTITSDEIVMYTVKAPKTPESWLYFFCLSIAFRMFVVASRGCPARFTGNINKWYDCFTTWREILLKEGSIKHKPMPKVGLFIAPVNVLDDLSAPMTKVLFSPGAGAFCNYRLYDGANISSSRAEFLLSSIGVVNIAVSFDEACFNFIPPECIVTFDSSKFVIPSAIRRYLLFPKGIWREYKNISALVTERMLNIPQDKVNAPFNRAWIGKEIKMFSGVLGESFDYCNVSMNFLPAPFNKNSTIQQTRATLKSCTAFKMILHVEHFISDDWYTTFLILSENHQIFPELFVILVFQSKSYVISVAYELSTVDLSIKEAIQSISTKAFFPQVECYFEIKNLLEDNLLKAVTKAGFTDKILLARWLRDFKSSNYCDLRCFPYCLTCINVCSCCMRTVSLADAIPIYYGEAKAAIACGSLCMNYLTSTTIMPITLYQPKNASDSHLALQVCTNGALFGFTNYRGKFVIHYFTSENDDEITVWCQYRMWYKQCICTISYDNMFNVIADQSTDASFSDLFINDEGRGKFIQFLKDVWQFYQSLLVEQVLDAMKIPQDDESIIVHADDGLQYFATMPISQLNFHTPHVQLK